MGGHGKRSCSDYPTVTPIPVPPLLPPIGTYDIHDEVVDVFLQFPQVMDISQNPPSHEIILKVFISEWAEYLSDLWLNTTLHKITFNLEGHSIDRLYLTIDNDPTPYKTLDGKTYEGMLNINIPYP